MNRVWRLLRHRTAVTQQRDATYEDQLLVHYLEKDDAENLASTPPAGENVEFHSFWLAECFPPAFTDALLKTVRELGWGTRDPTLGSDDAFESLDKWIEQSRGSPELSSNLVEKPSSALRDQAARATDCGAGFGCRMPSSKTHPSRTRVIRFSPPLRARQFCPSR